MIHLEADNFVFNQIKNMDNYDKLSTCEKEREEDLAEDTTSLEEKEDLIINQ